MFLIDVNLLIHAVNRDSPDHSRALAWWQGLESASESVGLPWLALVAFVRLATNQKVLEKPLPLSDALHVMQRLLSQPNVVVLHLTSRRAAEFARLCQAANAFSNLLTDTHLAALGIEHVCELASGDSDFARFPELRWSNPLAS